MVRSLLLCGATGIALLSSPAWAQPHPPVVERIVVTASPLGGDTSNLASIPSHIDTNDILRRGGATLADSLSSIPGVSSSGFASGASRPIIRGMDASRVRVLEDGTSSSDASDIGPDHGVPIDPLSARSIEVVRGAATLRYGSQAIGGVVNAINNRVPLTLPEKSGGEATISTDSVSRGGQLSLLGDTRLGNFAFHADGFYRRAGDYDTPLGTQANSYSRGNGVSLGGSYFFGEDSRAGAALIHYDSEYGIPSDITFIDMRQTKVLTNSHFDLHDGVFQSLNIIGSYGDYAHEEKDPLAGTVEATFKNKEFDGRIEVLLGAMGPFSSSALGVQIQNRQFSALGGGADYLLPALTQNYAGFFFTQAPITGALQLEASARLEHVQVEGTPASGLATTRGFTPLSGAVGLLFEVDEHIKLGLTGSSTARAPAQTELFARGAHDGPGTFETGNPLLKMERSNALEGTLRLRYGDFRLDSSIYGNWFDNYIYGALTGLDCDEDGNCAVGSGGELRQLNYTQSHAYFRGVEAKATYHLWHFPQGQVTLETLGDYVRATLPGGLNVPRIPPYRFGGGLAWEGEEFDAGFHVMRVGEQNKFGLFDTPTPGYVSLDAQITWRPIPDNDNIQLALIGQNLTDDIQRNAASFNKALVAAPGRNIRLLLKVAAG